MGTVSHLYDRARAPAQRIDSEEQALAVAHELAEEFRSASSTRDLDRIFPTDELDRLAQSGLLGITVPADYDGTDVSNAVLAEVIAILSEADSSIGQIPQNHFYILEALRLDGSEEQKKFFFGRALAGDRFGNALAETGTRTPGDYATQLEPDGIGYRVNGRKYYSTGVLFADWVVVFANDAEGRLNMAFLQRKSEGLQIIDDWDGFGQRTTGSGSTVFQNVYVNADSVVPHYRGLGRATTIGSVAQLIHAGVDLGIARAAFKDTIDFVRDQARPWHDSGVERAADDPLTISRVGQLAIRLDAATALVERAGRKVDIAQINGDEETVIDATLAVAGAKVLTSEIALEASNTLFELAGTASTKAGLNLDRHWRNARTHTLHDPLRWKYHAVGNYHLNGIKPPRNGTL